MINSKILGSVLVMGMALVLAGAGTMAYFHDTEVSKGNTFTAGELDLKVDWMEWYNGELIDTVGSVEEPIDLTGEPMISLPDVKPGDSGKLKISLHVYDNPAWLWVAIENMVDNEVSVNDAELEAGDDNLEVSEEGELSQYLQFDISWMTPDETITPLYSGTADEGTWLLDNIDNCETYWIILEWELPSNVGNIVQSDSLSADIIFYAEQTRHNDNPIYGEPDQQ